MTDANNIDEIRAIVADIARIQRASQYELDLLIENTNNVLGHNAIVGDMVLEIRENTEVLQRNFETHQQNFEISQQNILQILENQERNFTEHQRTTNAALNSLEAILLQLTRRDN
jgi:hypothetical protein